MSRIDALMAEFCPDGVEFKALEEIFFTKNGYTPSTSNKAYWTNGTIPWFRMDDIRANGRILGASLQRITEDAVKGGRLFPANSIIVATSATIGEHALVTVAHLSNQRFTSLSLKPAFAERLDMKFVFYYCFVLDEWCRNNTTTSSFASVDMNRFKKFRFPVPPIQIQKEIVKVLDTFTKLQTELEAELELRQQQYQHYRNALLTFDKRINSATNRPVIRWATLNEIATFKYGFTAKAKDTGRYRFIRITDIADNGKLSNENPKYIDESSDSFKCLVKQGDILMARTGATFGKTVFIKDEISAVYASFLIRIQFDIMKILPAYYWHFAQSNFYWQQVNKLVSIGGQPQFNANALKAVCIPIPAIEEQQRIVSILDRFDALVNDLSTGLPAEIAARRQQYEHYRDRLLTFRELA